MAGNCNENGPDQGVKEECDEEEGESDEKSGADETKPDDSPKMDGLTQESKEHTAQYVVTIMKSESNCSGQPKIMVRYQQSLGRQNNL